MVDATDALRSIGRQELKLGRKLSTVMTHLPTAQRARHTQHDFIDAHGARSWPRCTFQGLRDDPIDQFLFTYLGGQLRGVGGVYCDMWYEPVRHTQCPCAAPSSLLGGQFTVVEIGANDGLHMANSYFFEQHLGWRSLCIEANPVTFQRLVTNRPRCIKVNALVGNPESLSKKLAVPTSASPDSWPLVPFIAISRPPGTEKSVSHRDWETGLSGIEGSGHREISSLKAARAYAEKHSYPYAAQTLVANRTLLPLRPFTSIFREHSIRSVDVLFLDVEGAELAVLHSIDFDAVHIRIIVAEVLTPAGVPSAPASPHAGALANETASQTYTRRGRAVTSFLAAQGYRRLGLTFSLGDSVFVKAAIADGGTGSSDTAVTHSAVTRMALRHSMASSTALSHSPDSWWPWSWDWRWPQSLY